MNGIARQVIDLGLASGDIAAAPAFNSWQGSLASYDGGTVSRITGIDEERIKQAAILYATGGAGLKGAREGVFPPALLYQTVAHQGAAGIIEYGAGTGGVSNTEGDPAEITIACNNLAILTGNIGRAGGGVASLRGPANYQGVTDMGAHPGYLPGGLDVEDPAQRAIFETAWMPRWAAGAKTSNGFAPPRQLPATRGLAAGELAAAIERGTVKAMYVEGTIAGREQFLDPGLAAALSKLEFLVVADSFDSPLAKLAHVVLPRAMSLEKDGTFSNLDRTVQRVRVAVPAIGEAKSGVETIALLAQRMGYDLAYPHASQVMAEISRLVPDYAGVTYARLERGGVNVPVQSYMDPGSPILTAGLGRVRDVVAEFDRDGGRLDAGKAG